jgi:hypothetical protein
LGNVRAWYGRRISSCVAKRASLNLDCVGLMSSYAYLGKPRFTFTRGVSLTAVSSAFTPESSSLAGESSVCAGAPSVRAAGASLASVLTFGTAPFRFLPHPDRGGSFPAFRIAFFLRWDHQNKPARRRRVGRPAASAMVRASLGLPPPVAVLIAESGFWRLARMPLVTSSRLDYEDCSA